MQNNMKNYLTLCLLFIWIDIFSQSSHLDSSKINHLDSLELWSYDILTLKENEKIREGNPIYKIVFFRNTSIKDSLYENIIKRGHHCNDNGFRPAMIFNVYPMSKIDSVKKMSKWTKTLSSCSPPNVGGDYYVLRDFVLINFPSCTNCSTYSDRKIDLCRDNIAKIISYISYKEYLSFEQIFNDLPIKRGKYY
jgi:hypothetical protein